MIKTLDQSQIDVGRSLHCSRRHQPISAGERESWGSGSLEDKSTPHSFGRAAQVDAKYDLPVPSRWYGSPWMVSGLSAPLTIGSGSENVKHAKEIGPSRRLRSSLSLMKFKPPATVSVEKTRDRSYRSGMLSPKDHRELAARCLRTR